MAARRLVIVMLILLGASTLAAALVPVPAPEEESTQTEPPPPPGPAPQGELVRETVRVPPADESDPPTVRIALGDQLELTVHAAEPDEIEVPAFGELREIGPDTPAVFDLLPFEPGTYVARLVGAERTAARIVVEPRKEVTVEERERKEHRAVDERISRRG